MTVGEKIKYCRKQLGITQEKLAERTGIHHVSIRKYEINKMQPQPAQLERIADALGVSYHALNGIDHAGMRLQTVGDLMGLLMVLCHGGILQITGERGEPDNPHRLREDTVSIRLNPVLAPYFSIGGGKGELPLESALLRVKSKQIMGQLLDWEKIDFLYRRSVTAAGEHPNEATRAALEDLAEMKEKIELELQKSQIRLDGSDRVGVNVRPE